MIDFTSDHFDEVCGAAAVREQVESLETRRRAAVKKFWLYGGGGLVLALAALGTLLGSGWGAVAWILFGLLLFAAVVAAMTPLSRVKEGLKHPVLEEIAARAGLEYLPDGFTPPAYGSARGLLFGSGLSSQTFTDLFHGADAEGRGHAVYEACLQKRVGKNTTTVFSGQIYALHRRPGAAGETAIVPDRKIFNFFKPRAGMERVNIDTDPEFERRFEAYSTAPAEAKQLLFDTDFRRLLLELREQGRVLAYIGPEEVLVAVSGKDRFEPGNMFRARPGNERVRAMFDDVCASLSVLRRLKQALD